jgi:hypothetical protein
MSEVMLTTVLTVLSGVSIFVIVQLIVKIFVEPIHKLRGLKGDIVGFLTYYSDVYLSLPDLNKDEDVRKVSTEARKLGSDIIAKALTIPCYRFFSRLGLVPKFSDISIAHRELIGLSNTVLSKSNSVPERATKRLERIKSSLHLPKELLA